MLVFLRHNGCILCKKTLALLNQNLKWFDDRKITVILVHMDKKENAQRLFNNYKLGHLEQISDLDLALFDWAGSRRGTLNQNFGWKVVKAATSALKDGHRGGLPVGEPLRMPGVIFLKDGRVVLEHRYQHAGDDPNWVEFAEAALKVTCQ